MTSEETQVVLTATCLYPQPTITWRTTSWKRRKGSCEVDLGELTVLLGGLQGWRAEKQQRCDQDSHYSSETESHFNSKTRNKNEPVNTRCTNHLKKRVKYLLLNGRWNWPFYKKGTCRFLSVKSNRLNFLTFKNLNDLVIYITVLK